MLKIIKMITLQALNSNEEAGGDEEDVDYFSQHIYQAPPAPPPAAPAPTPAVPTTPVHEQPQQLIEAVVTNQSIEVSSPPSSSSQGFDQVDNQKQETIVKKEEGIETPTNTIPSSGLLNNRIIFFLNILGEFI